MAGLSESLRFKDNDELNESMKRLMRQFEAEVAGPIEPPRPVQALGGDVEAAMTMQPKDLRAAVSMRADDLVELRGNLRNNLLSLVKNVQRYIGQMELFVKGDTDQKRGTAAVVATGDRIYEDFERSPNVLYDFLKTQGLDRASVKKCFYVPQICSIMYSILDGNHSDDTILKVYELGYFLLQETTTQKPERGTVRTPRLGEEMNDIEVWMSVLILRMIYEKMSTAHDVYARLENHDDGRHRLAIREKAMGRMFYAPLVAMPFHKIITGKKEETVLRSRDELMIILHEKKRQGQIGPIPISFKEAMNELSAEPQLTFQHLIVNFTDLILG